MNEERTTNEKATATKSIDLPKDLTPLRSPDGRYLAYFHSSESMYELGDETVDLVVTSPPYGIGLRYFDPAKGPAKGQVERPVLSMGDYAAYLRSLEPIWREVYRVMKPSAYACINAAAIHAKSEFFGESFMLPIPDDIAHYWRAELGAHLRWKNIWAAGRNNTNANGETGAPHGSYPLPLEGQVRREIEEILVFRKPGPRGFDGMTEERAERRRKSTMTVKEWYDVFNQVWTFAGSPADRASNGLEHPASFPVELPLRCIRGYSCVGDTVLDPFLGTGTTMAAARRLDRRCVGYEVQGEFRNLIASKARVLNPDLANWCGEE